MDDEFTKILQGCDCHSTEYVTRYLTNYPPIFRVNSIHNCYFCVRNLVLRVLTALGRYFEIYIWGSWGQAELSQNVLVGGFVGVGN